MNTSTRSARRLALGLLLALVGALAAHSRSNAQPQDVKDKEKASWDEKAREAFVKRNFEDSLKYLREAIKSNPNAAPAELTFSKMCYEQVNADNANAGRWLQLSRQSMEKAAAEAPDHPEVLLANGFYSLREGRLTDTIFSCQAALGALASQENRWPIETKKGYEREARLELVQALEQRGEKYFPAVRDQVQGLIKLDPKNASYQLTLARAEVALRDQDAALRAAKLAFELDKTLDPPELYMAAIYQQRKDVKLAEEWFGKAVSAYGNGMGAGAVNAAKVHRAFAAFLLDRGDIGRAKLHMQSLMKVDPNTIPTKALLGLLARYERDYPGAVKIYEELYRNNPAFAANLALCLAESSEADTKERAITLANAFVRANNNSTEAHAILAYTHLKKGGKADIASAEAEANIAKQGQMSADTIYIVALILHEVGKAENAYEPLDAAIKGVAEGKDAFVYAAEARELLKKLPKPKEKPKTP